MSLSRLLLLTILALTALTTTVLGQASLVPANHPVYDWLYNQRVAGNLPAYEYEVLPLTRRDITRHLNYLRANASLSRAQQRSLDSYLREFDVARISPEGGHSAAVFYDTLDWGGGSIADRARTYLSDTEKHVLIMRSREGFLLLDGGIGLRAFVVRDGDLAQQTLSQLTDIRVIGGYGENMGFHGEINLASPVLGSGASIFAYDGFYFYNFINKERFAGNDLASVTYSLVHREGYATVQFGNTMAFSIGRGNLKIGTGEEDNFWFSRNAAPLEWLRLDIGNRWMRYQRLHGAMSWPASIIRQQDDPLLITRNAPQRFVVMQSGIVRPFPWFHFGVFEMINYSNRGMEIAYLNPINILSFAERDLQDQDNGWAGVYGVLRPLRGLELYSELVVDDLFTVSEIIRRKRPDVSRFARRYGAQWVPGADWRLFGEYERIDPFVYSHPYALNSHTNYDVSLGSQLEPNSDRLTAGVRWFGLPRSWVSVKVRYVRNGRSTRDADGNLIFYAGEDVNRGRRINHLLRPDERYEESFLFLDGDLHRWAGLELHASWEPRRAWVLSSRLDYRHMLEGDQLASRTVFWLDMRVGF